MDPHLREEVRLLGDFGEIAGRSGPLVRVLEDIAQVAVTDSTVLILGETGTGKELIARQSTPPAGGARARSSRSTTRLGS